MKNGRSDPSVCGSRLPGLELLGERQQPEFMQAWERSKRRTAIRVWGVREPLPEQDGAVEMWGHDAVPGEAGQCGRFESQSVVYEVGNNHLHDLWWEIVSLAGVCRSAWVPTYKQVSGTGFGAVPNSAQQGSDHNRVWLGVEMND